MTTDPATDGRRRKGERRRQLLLEATLRVIGREGTAAVSQRAVAAEAGVPPSAVMYYFATIDDLLVATLTAVNDEYIARLDSYTGDEPLEWLAAMIADGARRHRARVAAEYELFLMAARRPSMRAEAARWAVHLDAFLARCVTDRLARAGLAAAVDGLFLRCLCADDPPPATTIAAVLHKLVTTS